MNDGTGIGRQPKAEPFPFSAMGKPISAENRQNADDQLKRMGISSAETRFECVRIVAEQLERDKSHVAMKKAMQYVDATGAYILFSALLAETTVEEPRRYLMVLNDIENEDASKERVIEYAEHRLEANPGDRNDFDFDTFNMSIGQAIRVIGTYGEEVKMSTEEQIEEARGKWAKIAKERGWYTDPFYIQAWVEDGEVIDAVAHKGLTEDMIIEVTREDDDG